jgi:hypothetical protein
MQESADAVSRDQLYRQAYGQAAELARGLIHKAIR